jgi:hypothetical protein
MIRRFSEQQAYKLLILLVFAANIATGVASVLIAIGTILILADDSLRRRLLKEGGSLICVFAVYFGLQIIVAVCSLEPMVSFRELAGELHRVLPFLFPLAFLHIKSQLRYTMLAFVLLIAVNHVYGLYQYTVLHQRAYGFCHWPTFYGSFLLMCTPVAMCAASLNILRPYERRVSFVVAAAGLPMLLLSETRGAWIAFLGVCILFFFLYEGNRKHILGGIATVFLIFSLLLAVVPGMTARLATIGDASFQSNSERRLMWSVAIRLFEEHPITGVGLEQYGPLYNGEYYPPEAKEYGHGHPHNIVLKILSEGGILGIMAFFLLHGYFFMQFYRLNRAARGQHGVTFGMMGMLSLFGLFLEGMTDTNMNQVPIMREYWMIAGIVLASARFFSEKNTDIEERA